MEPIKFKPVSINLQKYDKKDLENIFKKIKFKDIPEELVEIRKEQILQHSNKHRIIDTLYRLTDLVGQADNKLNRTLLEQYNEELIELHSPVYNVPPQDIQSNPTWEKWTLQTLYWHYMNLVRRKEWDDHVVMDENTLILNYQVMDMLNILRVHKCIKGYDVYSFLLPPLDVSDLMLPFISDCVHVVLRDLVD